jgi:hypothetical protein
MFVLNVIKQVRSPERPRRVASANGPHPNFGEFLFHAFG